MVVVSFLSHAALAMRISNQVTIGKMHSLYLETVLMPKTLDKNLASIIFSKFYFWFLEFGMWKILVILIFGLVHANTNENYKIVSCNDPNKERLNVIVFYGRIDNGS